MESNKHLKRVIAKRGLQWTFARGSLDNKFLLTKLFKLGKIFLTKVIKLCRIFLIDPSLRRRGLKEAEFYDGINH